MSCCWGLLPPDGEALAGVEVEETGFSGIVLPPVVGGGIRGIPKEPRLRREAQDGRGQSWLAEALRAPKGTSSKLLGLQTLLNFAHCHMPSGVDLLLRDVPTSTL